MPDKLKSCPFCGNTVKNNNVPYTTGDMTLRDWFAGQALNKLTRPTRPVHDECYTLGRNARDCIAWDVKVAYAYADAMLAEKGKREGNNE